MRRSLFWAFLFGQGAGVRAVPVLSVFLVLVVLAVLVVFPAVAVFAVFAIVAVIAARRLSVEFNRGIIILLNVRLYGVF